MKKRLISLFVIIAMLCSCGIYTSAATLSQTSAAELLYSYGLFKGVGTNADGTPNFDLDRAPTRQEATVILIRLLGKEAVALSGTWKKPFFDVDSWAESYIAYAYQNGLSNGISAIEFGSQNTVTAEMYITFLLRALGYSDANGDFVWNNPYPLSDSIGLTNGNIYNSLFTRGDVCELSYKALECFIKNSGNTLYEYLKLSGAIKNEDNSNSTKTALTAAEVAAKASPSVFYIEVFDKNKQAVATGSGFFISPDGVAVTNFHVIDGTRYAQITTTDGKIYDATHVIYADENADVAVLKISQTSTDNKTIQEFPYLQLADSDKVANGEVCYAIGSPLGLQNTISNGIISNSNRIIDSVKFIQTTSAISSGSSGGVLVNEHAEVIGITSAGYTEGENLGLAIPINIIKNIDITIEGIPYFEFLKEYVNLSVSQQEIIVEAGNYVTCYVYAESNSEENWNIFCEEDDKTIAKCSWGSWIKSGIAVLYVEGLKEGNTQITISSDVDDKTVKINVTVTKSSIPRYSYGNLATYTYVTGKECVSTIKGGQKFSGYAEGGTSYTYMYDKTSVNKYISYLSSSGYYLRRQISDSSGYVYYYANGDNIVAITLTTLREVIISFPT